MTQRNLYLWPELVTITFRNSRGRVLLQSRNRKLDLSDTLMWGREYLTVCMSLATRSSKWQAWDERNVDWIERLIKKDLNYDGYYVRIHRNQVATAALPCTDEFTWKLKIGPRRQTIRKVVEFPPPTQ